jgi:hypothetical protein
MFFKRLGLIRLIFNYPNFYMASCITMAIIMNIFILLGFSIRSENVNTENINNVELFFTLNNESKKIYFNTASDIIFKTTGAILLFFSSLVFGEFLTRKAPLLYKNIIVRINYNN